MYWSNLAGKIVQGPNEYTTFENLTKNFRKIMSRSEFFPVQFHLQPYYFEAAEVTNVYPDPLAPGPTSKRMVFFDVFFHVFFHVFSKHVLGHFPLLFSIVVSQFCFPCGTRGQGPATSDQRPATRDQGPGIRDQRPGTRNQGPATSDQGQVARGQGSETSDQ